MKYTTGLRLVAFLSSLLATFSPELKVFGNLRFVSKNHNFSEDFLQSFGLVQPHYHQLPLSVLQPLPVNSFLPGIH